jgi:hypothetical protein
MRNALCVAAAAAFVAVLAVTCAASDSSGIAAAKKVVDGSAVTVSYYLHYSDGEGPGTGGGQACFRRDKRREAARGTGISRGRGHGRDA